MYFQNDLQLKINRFLGGKCKHLTCDPTRFIHHSIIRDRHIFKGHHFCYHTMIQSGIGKRLNENGPLQSMQSSCLHQRAIKPNQINEYIMLTGVQQIGIVHFTHTRQEWDIFKFHFLKQFEWEFNEIKRSERNKCSSQTSALSANTISTRCRDCVAGKDIGRWMTQENVSVIICQKSKMLLPQ